MSTITKSRRRQKRYDILPGCEASVEFEYPVPHGRQFRLPLTNMSASGVSFAVEDLSVLGRLEGGTNLQGAVVRIGECAIEGDLLVMHLTPGPDGRHVCGALLYPTTDMDLIKLKSLIAGLEAARSD